MPAQDAEHFLEDYDGHSLPWTKPAGAPVALETDRILFGNGDNALEVAIASATRPGQPKAEDLRALFKKRQANRPTLFFSSSHMSALVISRLPRSSALSGTLPRSPD